MKVKAGDIVVVRLKKISGTGKHKKTTFVYATMKVISITDGYFIAGWWNFEKIVENIVPNEIVYIASSREDAERYIENPE